MKHPIDNILKIGDTVTIVGEYEFDWRGVELTVHGMVRDPYRPGGIDYWLIEDGCGVTDGFSRDDLELVTFIRSRKERLEGTVARLSAVFRELVDKQHETPWWKFWEHIFLHFEINAARSHVRYAQTQLTIEIANGG